MKPWNERPFEIRNLLNPAFCGVILLRALQGFDEEQNTGMPFSLMLLILPLSLHKDTREVFSNNSRRYFLKTISDSPQILVGLSERANNLLPYTFEGLGFAMERQSFRVTDQGRIQMLNKGIRKKIDGSYESIECQKVAKSIGKKFGAIGNRVTIYTTLGLRP